MNPYYETLTLSLRPRTIELLEEAARQIDTDLEDERVACEVRDLANELRSRLQRIAAGDLQQ